MKRLVLLMLLTACGTDDEPDPQPPEPACTKVIIVEGKYPGSKTPIGVPSDECPKNNEGESQ